MSLVVFTCVYLMNLSGSLVLLVLYIVTRCKVRNSIAKERTNRLRTPFNTGTLTRSRSTELHKLCSLSFSLVF